MEELLLSYLRKWEASEGQAKFMLKGLLFPASDSLLLPLGSTIIPVPYSKCSTTRVSGSRLLGIAYWHLG